MYVHLNCCSSSQGKSVVYKEDQEVQKISSYDLVVCCVTLNFLEHTT